MVHFLKGQERVSRVSLSGQDRDRYHERRSHVPGRVPGYCKTTGTCNTIKAILFSSITFFVLFCSVYSVGLFVESAKRDVNKKAEWQEKTENDKKKKQR